MIKEKEDRIEVAWLGAAKYQWGHEGLLKEYAYAVSHMSSMYRWQTR
jgi:hypothetical protein